MAQFLPVVLLSDSGLESRVILVPRLNILRENVNFWGLLRFTMTYNAIEIYNARKNRNNNMSSTHTSTVMYSNTKKHVRLGLFSHTYKL